MGSNCGPRLLLSSTFALSACGDGGKLSDGAESSTTETTTAETTIAETGTGESETGDGDGDWGTPGECQFEGYADDCPFEWADIPALLPLDCALASPCASLTITHPFEMGDPSYDLTTYACIAQALRDGLPGRYTIHSAYADFGFRVLFDILPNRTTQRIGWAPDDIGGCSVRWETRPLLEPDYYQGCLDQTDPTLAAECLESMWSQPFECIPLDEISCPG